MSDRPDVNVTRVSAREAGYFSRRHKTAEAHNAVIAEREETEANYEYDLEERVQARLLRSPEEQLILLNKRLGEGVGARKERKRLKVQITEKNK